MSKPVSLRFASLNDPQIVTKKKLQKILGLLGYFTKLAFVYHCGVSGFWHTVNLKLLLLKGAKFKTNRQNNPKTSELDSKQNLRLMTSQR